MGWQLHRKLAIENGAGRLDADQFGGEGAPPQSSFAGANGALFGVLDQAPGFMAILRGPEHIVEFANQAFVHLTGQRDVVGRLVSAAFPELEAQGVFQPVDQVGRTGERHVTHNLPLRLQRSGAGSVEERFVDFIYAPIIGATGEMTGVFIQGHDVTETYISNRKQEETRRRQDLLIELNDRLRDLEDPAEVSYAAAELLGRTLKISRAGYGVVDVAAETITIKRDWNAGGVETLAGMLHVRDYAYIEDLKRGETVVFADAEQDPRAAASAEALKALGAWASVSIPLTEKQGFVDLLYLNHASPRPWTSDELALIEEVAERTRTALARRRAEQKLRELTYRFQFAQRVAQAVTWEHDLQTGCTYWSDVQAIRDLLGVDLPPATPVREWLRHIHPDDRQHYFDQWNQSLPTGEGHVIVRALRRGETRWLEAFGRVTETGPDGRPRRLVGISMDITERRSAELARAESEARLELATRAANLGIWDWNLERNEVHFEPRARVLWGFPATGPVTQAMMAERMHPDDVEETNARFERAIDPVLRDGSAYQYRVVRPGGEVRWLRAHARAVFEDRDGKLTAVRYVGTMEDITETRRREEALIASEARLRLALEAGRMAVWAVDAGENVEVTPELNRLLGFPEDARPSLEEIQARYYPGELERLQELGRLALERGDRQVEVEYQHIWPNGEPRWLLVRAEFLLSDSGTQLGAIGVVMDITERRESEERLKLLAREVDHRANNLLAVVQGAITLSDAPTAAELKTALLGRLAALAKAHQLLASSRWVGADLEQLVRDELEPYCLHTPDCTTIRGPPVALSPAVAQGLAMVLHELATNAVKYGALSTERGGVEVSWTGGEGDGLVLTWRETGGPPIVQPTRTGMGTRVIARALGGHLGGRTEMDWRPEGLVCRIEVIATAHAAPG